jgi:hypothetical protein
VQKDAAEQVGAGKIEKFGAMSTQQSEKFQIFLR